MTVGELIEKLQQLDPDLYVFVHGYEGGYADASVSDIKDIALNVNDEWYYGPHEDANNESHVPEKTQYKIVKGIIL
jgi:hypothetical protein